METMSKIVITGLGVKAPSGLTVKTFWDQTKQGVNFISPITRFDCSNLDIHLAGLIEEFDPYAHLPKKTVSQSDRSTHLLAAALDDAFDDAKLPTGYFQPHEIGVCLASCFGGIQFSEPELYAQVFNGPHRVSAYQAIAWFYAATQGQWTIHRGVQGFAKSLVAGRAGGLEAIVMGSIALRNEHAKVFLCGGADAPVTPFSLMIHKSANWLTTAKQPDDAYLPFDTRASGAVLAEGAGAIVLENEAKTIDRQDQIYSILLGSAVTHSHDVHDEHQYLACIEQAIDNAGLTPKQISFIIPDACGVSALDDIEARCLLRLFKDKIPPVTVPRTTIGHALSGAGVLDFVLACLMLKYQIILPTINVQETTYPLLLVRNQFIQIPLNYGLLCQRGEGGINIAVVVGKYQ
jgi:act minimal PKS chain-length factor (CLF/KS beta)